MAWLIGILAAALIGIISLQFRGRRITSLGSPKRLSSGTGRERSGDQEPDFALGRDAESLLARLQRGRVWPLRGGTQQEDLDLRLSDIAAWCQARLNADKTPVALRPGGAEQPKLTGNRWAVVDALARQRGPASDLGSDHPLSGRFLIYFPDGSLFDGAAAMMSDGFFDDDNAPPWGTWVGYFQDDPFASTYSGYLLAWVPAAFLGAVQAGIDVNPEQCIHWLDDSGVELRWVLPRGVIPVRAIAEPRSSAEQHIQGGPLGDWFNTRPTAPPPPGPLSRPANVLAVARSHDGSAELRIVKRWDGLLTFEIEAWTNFEDAGGGTHLQWHTFHPWGAVPTDSFERIVELALADAEARALTMGPVEQILPGPSA